MDKQALIERIRTERALLDALVLSLHEPALAAAPVAGWSPRDHLAHIAVWERMIAAHLRDGSEHEVLTMDRDAYLAANADMLNDAIYRQHIDRSVAEVRQMYGAAHQELLQALEQLDDAALAQRYWPDDPSGGTVEQKIAGDTYLHYREHGTWIGELLVATDVEKSALLESIRAERARLDALVDSLDEARLVAPTFDGGWSVKDVLVHIAAWERRCLGWIASGERGEPPDRPEGTFTDEEVDRFNAATYEANRDRPLADVRQEYRRSFEEMVACVDRLSDNDLVAPDRWAWAGGRPLLPFVRANADWHYREHHEAIEAWLERTREGAR